MSCKNIAVDSTAQSPPRRPLWHCCGQGLAAPRGQRDPQSTGMPRDGTSTAWSPALPPQGPARGPHFRMSSAGSQCRGSDLTGKFTGGIWKGFKILLYSYQGIFKIECTRFSDTLVSVCWKCTDMLSLKDIWLKPLWELALVTAPSCRLLFLQLTWVWLI